LATLTVTNSATDADLPANTLTYTLVGAPSGASISSSGVITWTPAEAQGPTNVTLTTVVTDNGIPPLSATNSFVVEVRELNVAPTITVPSSEQVIEESTLFTVTITGGDTDQPANPLTFRLVSPPEGMILNPASGQISWTPTEAQGPGTYTVTVVGTDTNGAAATSQQLSVTNSFTVRVTETNAAPVIADIPPQSVHFGIPLKITTSVTDPDIPANTVTLSLVNAPEGMTLDAATGTINWTPAEAQLGVHTATLRATDNGTPNASSTKTFQVTVTGSGASIDVTTLANNLVQLTITGDANHNYELQKSTDLTTWEALVTVPLKDTPYQHIEPMNTARRFYRLKLLQ
jgi:hypothetical protein